MVRMHQVIQRVTRDALTSDRYRDASWSTGDALYESWPDIERDTELVTALRACTTALVSATGESSDHAGCLYRSHAHPVLFRRGNSLADSGQVTAATHHFQQLSETATRHLGSDHRDALAVRGRLAHWRGEAGDPAERQQPSPNCCRIKCAYSAPTTPRPSPLAATTLPVWARQGTLPEQQLHSPSCWTTRFAYSAPTTKPPSPLATNSPNGGIRRPRPGA